MGAVREEALASAGVRADGAIGISAAPRALLEGLLDAVVGGRAPEPGAPRSGCRGRSLDACVGRAALGTPELREGACFPEGVVARRSRADAAPAPAACDMRAAGVSTGKVCSLT